MSVRRMLTALMAGVLVCGVRASRRRRAHRRRKGRGQAPLQSRRAPQAGDAACAPAGGAEPTLIGQFGTWGAYTATPNGKKVCFALAKPSSSKTNPPNRPRDPAYAFVSTRPAEKVVNEVSIMIGYTLKPGSESTLEVGGASYAMYTQGDGLWIKNAAEEERMVDAMRKSADVDRQGRLGQGHRDHRHLLAEGAVPGARPAGAGLQALSGIRVQIDAFSAFPAGRWKAYLIVHDRHRDHHTRPDSGANAPLEKIAARNLRAAGKAVADRAVARASSPSAWATSACAPAQRKMRVQQLWHWIYFRGAKNFDEMTSISKEMRAQLDQHFTVARPEVVAEQISNDGTRKWLLRLPSGDQVERPHEVECVYIPETDRGTLCVSSQVGCTLNCSFCHTGTQRLVRNLTAGEIVGQVMVARDASTTGPTARRRPAAASSPMW